MFQNMDREVIFLPMEDYNDYSPDGEEVPVGARLCIQVSEQAKVIGRFNMELDGAAELDAEVAAGVIAQFGGSLGYKLAFKFQPAEVRTSPNSFFGPWEDLEDR